MPAINIYKEYVPDSYYHVYNRGVNKADIFLDKDDRVVFLSLLKRYFGHDPDKHANGTLRANYYDRIELLAFCLMDNHYHLLVYQHDKTAVRDVMKSIGVAYSMYFNKRYQRVGPVFQQRYRAVRIDDDAQLLHISRYIHMNPAEYVTYQWSSLPYYLGKQRAGWMQPARILELFEGKDYLEFLNEYRDRRDELAAVKSSLADANL